MNLQRLEERQCEFVGCGNKFVGPPQQKYCTAAECVEARRILAQQNRKPKIDKDSNNLTITKGKFQNGTILNIQCAAIGTTGRCKNSFTIAYDPTRTIYTKFCECHRNAWQRSRFEGKVLVNAEHQAK